MMPESLATFLGWQSRPLFSNDHLAQTVISNSFDSLTLVPRTSVAYLQQGIVGRELTISPVTRVFQQPKTPGEDCRQTV